MPQLRIVDGPPPDTRREAWYEGVSFTDPADGGYVHAVNRSDLSAFPGSSPGPWWPGMVFRVDADESFADGTQLASAGNGRVRAASTGDVLVATALEASSGVGDNIWVVAETQREL